MESSKHCKCIYICSIGLHFLPSQPANLMVGCLVVLSLGWLAYGLLVLSPHTPHKGGADLEGNRTKGILVRVSEEEKDLILQRMRQAGITNLSAYTRQMLINGWIIRRDFKELKGLTAQIGRIGSNVNQIAKRANESRIVTQEDIDNVI